MEGKEEHLPEKQTKPPFIPEKYVWKKSYSLVLIANVVYIIFFYFLMTIFQ